MRVLARDHLARVVLIRANGGRLLRMKDLVNMIRIPNPIVWALSRLIPPAPDSADELLDRLRAVNPFPHSHVSPVTRKLPSHHQSSGVIRPLACGVRQSGEHARNDYGISS